MKPGPPLAPTSVSTSALCLLTSWRLQRSWGQARVKMGACHPGSLGASAFFVGWVATCQLFHL